MMEDHEQICPYLDVPFQHVSRRLLEAMGRDPGHEPPLALVERIRSRRRPISLRTTLMVGFPGETDAEFRELLEFVRAAEFEHMGAFVFSREEGSRAARLKDVTPAKTAAARRRKLMTLQAKIAAAGNRRAVGSVLPVLIEGVCPETDLLLTGRTAGMAPEVDGRVLINKGRGIEGEVMPVLVRESHAYDLVGEIVESD
jgi:ribosomal protein S12 methylthiotransferase